MITDSMQHRAEIDLSKDMAAYTYPRLGCRRDPARYHTEYGGLLRCSFCAGDDGEWPLSRSRLLPVDVVQARGTALPHLPLLQRCIVGRSLWWHIGMGK